MAGSGGQGGQSGGFGNMGGGFNQPPQQMGGGYGGGFGGGYGGMGGGYGGGFGGGFNQPNITRDTFQPTRPSSGMGFGQALQNTIGMGGGSNQPQVPSWVTPPPENTPQAQAYQQLTNPQTGETWMAPSSGYSLKTGMPGQGPQSGVAPPQASQNFQEVFEKMQRPGQYLAMRPSDTLEQRAQSGMSTAPRPNSFAQYGFDPQLQSYLDEQMRLSPMDAGVAYQYDPDTQTFKGGTMSGPVTYTLAQMQNMAAQQGQQGRYRPAQNDGEMQAMQRRYATSGQDYRTVTPQQIQQRQQIQQMQDQMAGRMMQGLRGGYGGGYGYGPAPYGGSYGGGYGPYGGSYGGGYGGSAPVMSLMQMLLPQSRGYYFKEGGSVNQGIAALLK